MEANISQEYPEVEVIPIARNPVTLNSLICVTSAERLTRIRIRFFDLIVLESLFFDLMTLRYVFLAGIAHNGVEIGHTKMTREQREACGEYYESLLWLSLEEVVTRAAGKKGTYARLLADLESTLRGNALELLGVDLRGIQLAAARRKVAA